MGVDEIRSEVVLARNRIPVRRQFPVSLWTRPRFPRRVVLTNGLLNSPGRDRHWSLVCDRRAGSRFGVGRQARSLLGIGSGHPTGARGIPADRFLGTGLGPVMCLIGDGSALIAHSLGHPGCDSLFGGGGCSCSCKKISLSGCQVESQAVPGIPELPSSQL